MDIRAHGSSSLGGAIVTITKTTKNAKQAIANARNIRCYNLSNHFSGEPLADKPVLWGTAVGDLSRSLIEVSQSDFLFSELRSRHAKLSCAEVLQGSDWKLNGHYCLHVHANLWYEFEA